LATAFLILTTRCNRRCSYCFYETGYQDRGDQKLTLEVDEALLCLLGRSRIDKLILTGGEPLLLPGIVETVRLAAGRGFFTLLLTNAELLTPDLLERLVGAGLRAISISLDSIVEGPEDKAPWRSLELVAARRDLSCAVITPISRRNLSALPGIMERISGLGLYILLQPVFAPNRFS